MIEVIEGIKNTKFGELLTIFNKHLNLPEFKKAQDYVYIENFVDRFSRNMNNIEKHYLIMSLISTKGTRVCLRYLDDKNLNLYTISITYNGNLDLEIVIDEITDVCGTEALKYFEEAMNHLLVFKKLIMKLNRYIQVVDLSNVIVNNMDIKLINYIKGEEYVSN